MKIGLTGPKGMIGRHMKALLDREGIECVMAGRDEWDLTVWRTRRELDELFGDVDAIFHFGAHVPKTRPGENDEEREKRLIFDVNIRSCLNLAEWTKQKEIPLIFLSGATVYKDAHAECIAENAPKVVNGFGGFYGYSKLLSEKIISHYAASGLKTVMLRPSSVYGAGLPHDKLIQQYLSLAKANQPIAIRESANRINLIHAHDVTLAALSALRAQSWGIYNIAGPKAVSVRDIAATCRDVVGSSSVVTEVNSDEHDSFLRFDLDCSKAQRAFGYSPLVQLRKGLEMMSSGELLPG